MGLFPSGLSLEGRAGQPAQPPANIGIHSQSCSWRVPAQTGMVHSGPELGEGRGPPGPGAAPAGERAGGEAPVSGPATLTVPTYTVKRMGPEPQAGVWLSGLLVVTPVKGVGGMGRVGVSALLWKVRGGPAGLCGPRGWGKPRGRSLRRTIRKAHLLLISFRRFHCLLGQWDSFLMRDFPEPRVW